MHTRNTKKRHGRVSRLSDTRYSASESEYEKFKHLIVISLEIKHFFILINSFTFIFLVIFLGILSPGKWNWPELQLYHRCNLIKVSVCNSLIFSKTGYLGSLGKPTLIYPLYGYKFHRSYADSVIIVIITSPFQCIQLLNIQNAITYLL